MPDQTTMRFRRYQTVSRQLRAQGWRPGPLAEGDRTVTTPCPHCGAPADRQLPQGWRRGRGEYNLTVSCVACNFTQEV